ncbi:hypothetical protein Tco_1532976 [Tanacetum coccineum]
MWVEYFGYGARVLSKKGSRVWKGVKEKQVSIADKTVEIGMHGNVTGEQVVKEKQSSLLIRGSTLAGNSPGGNRIEVVMSVESIRAISERFANTAYGFFLGKRMAYPGMSSYARVMIELRADVELKDTIVVAMPKLTREGFIREECPKNTGLGVAKNLKKPCQAPKGVLVGPKVGFKPAKEYRRVLKKPTTNTSCNKKKVVEPTKEVSNSNPFDMLNLVDNDGELGINGMTSNLASNGANSSGSSFWNVETSSTSTTLIVDKTGKIKKLIFDGKVTLVDDDGKPLKKVDYSDDHDSEDEVESVDNNMDRAGFGTQSQDLRDNIQELCDNLDIRVRGRRKK